MLTDNSWAEILLLMFYDTVVFLQLSMHKLGIKSSFSIDFWCCCSSTVYCYSPSITKSTKRSLSALQCPVSIQTQKGIWAVTALIHGHCEKKMDAQSYPAVRWNKAYGWTSERERELYSLFGREGPINK